MVDARFAESLDQQVNRLIASIAQKNGVVCNTLQCGDLILQVPLQGIGVAVIRLVPWIFVGIEKHHGFARVFIPGR